LGGALLLALLALDFDDRLDFSPTQPFDDRVALLNIEQQDASELIGGETF